MSTILAETVHRLSTFWRLLLAIFDHLPRMIARHARSAGGPAIETGVAMHFLSGETVGALSLQAIHQAMTRAGKHPRLRRRHRGDRGMMRLTVVPLLGVVALLVGSESFRVQIVKVAES